MDDIAQTKTPALDSLTWSLAALALAHIRIGVAQIPMKPIPIHTIIRGGLLVDISYSLRARALALILS